MPRCRIDAGQRKADFPTGANLWQVAGPARHRSCLCRSPRLGPRSLAAVTLPKAPKAEADKPGCRFPSTFTILYGLIILVAALTRIIPAGQYTRVASEALGQDIPVAGRYAPNDANQQGIFDATLDPDYCRGVDAAGADMTGCMGR